MTIKFPDFNKIINHCKLVMNIKFKQYGNSWVDLRYDPSTTSSENEFWIKRLDTEFKEFLNAKTVDESKKELVDMINVCSMIYENTGDKK